RPEPPLLDAQDLALAASRARPPEAAVQAMMRTVLSRRRDDDSAALHDGVDQRLQGAPAVVDPRSRARARRHRYVRRRAQTRAVSYAESFRPDAGDAGRRFHDRRFARMPRLPRAQVRSHESMVADRRGRRGEGGGMDVEVRERDTP